MGRGAGAGPSLAPLTSRRRSTLLLIIVASVLAGSCSNRLGLGPVGVGAVGSVVSVVGEPPSDEVRALAAGSMSSEGRRLFFATNPKILDRADFGLECGADETDRVLGCYGDRRIFILRVTGPGLSRVMEVTAAHEMLHAAYEALPVVERQRVDALVGAAYDRTTDASLRELVAEYEAADPGQVPDELHSILPTQLASLGPDLDTYYGRYFADRADVIEAYQASEGLLDDLDRRIDELVAQVEALEVQLEALEVRVDAEEAALEDTDRRLLSLGARGSTEAFNRLVPARNAQARSVEAMIDQYNRVVDDYNNKVDQIDALALEQDQLVDSLDGRPSLSP